MSSSVVRRGLCALTVLVMSACGPTPSTPVSSGAPIPVLGTENFYADLLAQIGGARVSASSILNDPSADPHEYEASPAAAKLVADSRLVIVNGIGYDDFMQKLLGASTKSDRVVITVRKVKALLYNSQVTSPLTEQIRDLAVRSNVPVVAVAETIPATFKTFQEWQLAQLDDLEKALAK